MKKGLEVGIIALFIATSVTPVVFGYHTSQEIGLLKGEQYNYDSYHYACNTLNYRFIFHTNPFSPVREI